MNVRSGLAAAGVVVAAAVGLAGCGSSGSSGSSAPAGATATAPGTGGPTTSASAAAGGVASPAPAPSWAAALGVGVTVVGPKPVSPGNGSPEAVATGLIAAEDSGNYTSICDYYLPSIQAQCRAQIAPEASASPSAIASEIGNVTHFAVGYTAVLGDDALVGTTGTYCAVDNCYTNSDPAALFSSGKPFTTLWINANATDSTGGYSLVPVTKVDGKWYIFSSS